MNTISLDKVEDIINSRARVKIQSGFSNNVYLVDDKYILRIPKEYRDPGVNYFVEENIIQALNKTSISEKVLYHDEKTGLKISKKIKDAYNIESYDDETIIELAKEIKLLHKLAIETVSYNILNKMKQYKENLKEEDFIDEKYEKKITNSYMIIDGKYPQVLSHNDIVLNNIMKLKSNVRLIDFEFASNNMQLFDIASFISENDLSTHQIDLFIKQFEQQPNSEFIKDLSITIQMQNILFYYWSMHMYYMRKEKSYLEIALDKKSKILKYLISD
ncbi:MAG: phosphotransferase [Bacilli bacterium]